VHLSRRQLLCVFGLGLLAAVLVRQTSRTRAQNPTDKAKEVDSPLPIRQVVLFNSGVGYFQREGEVEGDSRVDLTFPVGDINDLLKSLVLQDRGGGLISSVNYDSHDPIEKILRGFALDLNNNPSFGQILNQARGEKIEITRLDKKAGPLAKLAGTIVGMETVATGTSAEVEMLNMTGPAGLQSIPLAQVTGVKFLNPILSNEFQRALQLLATSHDTRKKLVSLGFRGTGKRAVRVGYVVERPIWKTSYRLRLEPNGKVFLQGWAMVENTTDDDWNDVRMVLVSGKPISYQMNLYEPLYIPRPFVEPEHFASLRPPVYSGALDNAGKDGNKAQAFQQNIANPFAGGGQLGQFGVGGQIGQFGMMGAGPPPTPISEGGPADLGGMIGGMVGQVRGSFNGGAFQGGFNGQFGQFGGSFQGNRYQQNPTNPLTTANPFTNRLTYEELQQRRRHKAEANGEAKQAGSAIAGMNFKEGIQSVATAEEVGDYYQYVLDQRITMPRQKSAMVPILDQTIEGAKVSIYNEETHARYPLLGLRLKNTSGKPLTQGPITVYDGGNYAGDTRILDLQPGEVRLLSYALDQSTEIKTETKTTPGPTMLLRIDEPSLAARFIMRQTKSYMAKNRSVHDRTLIVEHPIRAGWKLVSTMPNEQTRDVYRFTIPVPAGKTTSLEVAEEQPHVDKYALEGTKPQVAAFLGIGIKMYTHQYEDKLLELNVQKGSLLATIKSLTSKTYLVQNNSEEDREFAIDYPIRPEWALLDDGGKPQKVGPDVFRFKLSVPRGKAAARELREERIHKQKGRALKDMLESELREYLDHPIPSAQVKEALSKVFRLDANVQETTKQLAITEKQLDDVTKDQARLRSNLQIIPRTSEHFPKFLEKFVAQETTIENLLRQSGQLQTALQGQQREYQKFITTLNAK
jgi:hypothetical protein